MLASSNSGYECSGRDRTADQGRGGQLVDFLIINVPPTHALLAVGPLLSAPLHGVSRPTQRAVGLVCSLAHNKTTFLRNIHPSGQGTQYRLSLIIPRNPQMSGPEPVLDTPQSAPQVGFVGRRQHLSFGRKIRGTCEEDRSKQKPPPVAGDIPTDNRLYLWRCRVI